MTKIRPDDGCVIISGAGSGLGRALSCKLTEQGFVVFGLGRRLAALEETQAICARDRFHPLPMDISRAEDVRFRVDGIEEAHGPIAILINNAATYPREDFLAAPSASFMRAVEVNLGGTVHLTHAVLRHMVQRGRGRVLNVATFADLNPLAGAGAYSVSKGATRIFTRALIADLSDRFPDIVIGDWMPGMLRTGMGIPDGLDPSEAAGWGAALAIDADPTLTGAVFEMGQEILPPMGAKGKIKALLTGNRPVPRRIDPV